MSMRVFVVFKVAVYRHECGGVFTTFEDARTAALTLIAGERDDHHQYEVVPFELDAATTQTRKENRSGNVGKWYWSGGDLEEADALLTLSRDGDEVRETPNAS